MLQNYFAPAAHEENFELYQKRNIENVIQTLEEARSFILVQYAEHCEAARLLKEHNIPAGGVDMPEEHAETLADLLASFEQARACLLDS